MCKQCQEGEEKWKDETIESIIAKCGKEARSGDNVYSILYKLVIPFCIYQEHHEHCLLENSYEIPYNDNRIYPDTIDGKKSKSCANVT